MNTFDRLKEIFKEVFGDDVDMSSVSGTSALHDDLGINSIGMLYMAMAIEREFGVKFDNFDFEKLITVGDVIAVIDGKR